jgi:release factor glutamine methyltransferase
VAVAVYVTSDELLDLVTRLRDGGSVFAEEEADLLVAEAQSPDQLAAMTAARIAGRPLEQILGWAEFSGLRLQVAPGVFVPRRRTQLLARCAIESIRARPTTSTPAVVVDLCCGTGAIGAAVLAAAPTVELFLADIDPRAVECARQNSPSATVLEGDLYEALPSRLRGRVDVLVVNAPYVPSDAVPLMPREARAHEALASLDGGPDGLDVLRRVAAGAADWLCPDGLLVVEASSEQSGVLLADLAQRGLAATVVGADDLDATAILARRATTTAS